MVRTRDQIYKARIKEILEKYNMTLEELKDWLLEPVKIPEYKQEF